MRLPSVVVQERLKQCQVGLDCFPSKPPEHVLSLGLISSRY